MTCFQARDPSMFGLELSVGAERCVISDDGHISVPDVVADRLLVSPSLYLMLDDCERCESDRERRQKKAADQKSEPKGNPEEKTEDPSGKDEDSEALKPEPLDDGEAEEKLTDPGDEAQKQETKTADVSEPEAEGEPSEDSKALKPEPKSKRNKNKS